MDGRQATGVCSYTIGPKGSEYSLSIQIPNELDPQAVLQFGPSRDYLCRPPAPARGPVKCGEPGIMAVWVTDSGNPVLFGMVGSGTFDWAEARRRLANSPPKPSADHHEVKAAAIALPVPSIPPVITVRPSNREPSGRSEPPFLSAAESGVAALAESGTGQIATAVLPEAAVRAQTAAGHAESALQPPLPAPWQIHPQPLVVKRAPRPSPHPPVYSPLWDDVSAEFEKMLDSLPKAQPFNGNAADAKIVEVPTGGAVQCYVGSVMVNGVKVFLQAVPARPYSRPAGFDHSLVSRDGECYWVKYFIQNS